MSIHKSKGLEFPVVLLAGCGKRFNLQDMNKGVLLHQELGFGPDVVDYVKRLAYPSVPKQAIREKTRLETLSEEMRILYVALTRAREKLIITGTVSNAESAAAKWARCASTRERNLPAYRVLKGSSFLDWIGPALFRHRNTRIREVLPGGGGFKGLLLDDPSVWDIHVLDKSGLRSGNNEEQQEESVLERLVASLDSDTGDRLSEEAVREVERRLGWSYPYGKASQVPAKVSVTELKRRFESTFSEESGSMPEYLPPLTRKPRFLEEKRGLSAAEAGTVMHFVMQHLEIGRTDIETQLAEMAAKALLTTKQAESVDTGKIRAFMASGTGRRLLSAAKVYREVPFNIEIPCSELYLGLDAEEYKPETILLQGVIDCWFEEPDGIVLLDYKTDYVPAGNAAALKERYRLQIAYYSRALEMLTGRRVKEKYIYLFNTGDILEY